MGNLIVEVVVDLAARNPDRQGTIDFITLCSAELTARRAFHENPTPANLTAWCDANDAVENLRGVQK